jgi:putative hydrolase of the HAD superfamily
MKARYLIWDFDGTLAYRRGGWSGALAETLQQEASGCDVTANSLRPYLQDGFPWHYPERFHGPWTGADAWWESLTPIFERAYCCGAGLRPSDAHRLAQEVRQVYVDPTFWHLFDDTLPCIRSLSAQDWQHFVLSNHVPELPQLMEALGLSNSVSRVFNSAETGFEKPHPRAFHNVLTAVEGDAAVWMIGDSMKSDFDGARAVGIPAILVRNWHPNAKPYCDNLGALPKLLGQP